MADGQPIKVEITAVINGLIDGLKNATGAVKANTDQMSSSFGSLARTVENLKTPFLALTGLLAGGALFKGAIDSANEWNGQVMKMSKTLGMTTEDASVLGVALRHLGIDTDTYTRAAQILARQIATGGKAFEQAGIDIRDSNGNLRSSGELMQEAITYLQGMKEGTDRNAAGVALFGRAWGELRDILKLTPKAMEEAEERAKRLHLIVGPEGAAATKQYKAEMRDVEDVFKSLRVQVGNELLPLLVQLGAWMAEKGTSLADGFSYAIKGIVQAFLFLKVAVEQVTTVLAALFTTLYDGLAGAGKAMSRLLAGDIKGAVAAIKAAGREMSGDWNAGNQQLAANWSGFTKASGELWGPRKKSTSAASDGNAFEAKAGKDEKGKDEKDGRLQAYDEELKQLKLVEENWFTWSEGRELAFWQDKLAMSSGSLDLQVQVLAKVREQQKKMAEAEVAEQLRQRQEGHDEMVAGLREQLEEYRHNGEMRLRILRAIAAEEAALYGGTSKQAQKALRDITKEANVQAKETAQSVAHIAASIGQTLGSVFSGLLTGTMSVAKAIAVMLQQVLQLIVQMATKSIMAKAADAAAGAAASQSWIPVVGPALAIGAMTAMLGAVMGLLGNVSAAGGYDIPAGVNPVVQTHQREMILPARYADVIRGMADGGGGGGGGGDTFNFQLHGTDGPSIERLVLSDDFQRAVGKAVRRGRWRG